MSLATIRALLPADPELISTAFTAIGWHKPRSQYERYFDEQTSGARDCFVATVNEIFAGYVTVLWQSGYLAFLEAGIPEISDFNVLPRWRRRGIGSRLMDAAEQRIATRCSIAGIGVGLYVDYGAAQKLYFQRGYEPDGRGVHYNGSPVPPGSDVRLDDALNLYFTRQLNKGTSE